MSKDKNWMHDGGKKTNSERENTQQAMCVDSSQQRNPTKARTWTGSAADGNTM
jgi:hypothetical protein